MKNLENSNEINKSMKNMRSNLTSVKESGREIKSDIKEVSSVNTLTTIFNGSEKNDL